MASEPFMPPILNPGPHAPDTFTPDVGQRIDAAGKVTYDFQGHVKGGSFDLDASNGTAPWDGKDIRWARTSDGTMVATIIGQEGVNFRKLGLYVEDDGTAPAGSQVWSEAGLQTGYNGGGISHRRRLCGRMGSASPILNDGTGDSDNVGLRGGAETGHRIQLLWDGSIRCYVDNIYVGAISLV